MPTTAATFTVHSPEWLKQFEDWAIVSGMGIVDAWRYQARQVCSALCLGYEERGKKSWNQATPPNDRKQGEGALRRDIHRAVFPLRADGFRDIKVRKKVRLAVRNEDVPQLQAMVRAGVFGSNRVNMRVLPAGNEYTAHQNSRSSRGRVLIKTPRFATVGDAYLKQYEREAKHTVGQAKGGWAAGLINLGGKVPEWIARHKKAGTFVDNLKAGQENLSFTLINRSQWAGDGEAQRITESVLANRAELIKADMAFLLAHNWQRDSGGRIVQ